ncbi:hypothetical protein HDV00_000056 [Rhizophlyctis rosea]|nr:hypothetical protein HDV00_000056 [Rhizophlyctis rosea]
MAAQTEGGLFELERTQSFDLPASKTTINIYRHRDSQFRLVFVPLRGPLCSTSIVVPTVAEDDKGLPHTLEHLVFCGSKNIPNRGYLDYLATRCLSTGTNAWTAEDHTAYTITTAGSEGIPRQFMTEVYHIDGSGKRQGVVYCEMASRENTEPDLLDNALRSLLYGPKTPYSHECGGRTKDIVTLTNDEIITYHQQFYNLDNMTVVICGQLDENALFERLRHAPGVLDARKGGKPSPIPVIGSSAISKDKPIVENFRTQTVPFPSSDEDLGSIAYSWHGPASSDIPTIVALDVLFRYLHETSASPLSQAFVERDDPYASHVDVELKRYMESAIQIVFSGVPYHAPGGGEEDVEMKDADSEGSLDVEEHDGEKGWEDESQSDEEMGSEDEEDESGSEGGGGATSRTDLFEPNVYRNLVMDVLTSFASQPSPPVDLMHATIRRHRRKILEGLEEDPHETIASYLIPDIVRHAFGSPSGSEGDQSGAAPQIGTRAAILAELNALEGEDGRFWCDLAQKWMVDAPVVEVLMVPSKKLAEEQSRKEVEELEARRKELGEDGLRRLGEEVKKAIKENEINLPPELIKRMPPVPDVTKAARLLAEVEVVDLRNRAAARSVKPFVAAQVVRTETAFTHLRIGLQTTSIPLELRPYLVLFQELMFQTPLVVPTPTGTTETIDYRDVVKRTADLFISSEAAVGFGNDLWSASWLSEVFMMSFSSEQADFERGVEFLLQNLLLSSFTKERILTTAKNLLSEVVEVKRDGSAMMHAVATRVGGVGRGGVGNDEAVSVFRQERVLKGIVRGCENGKWVGVVRCLEGIREGLIRGVVGGVGFMQVAGPVGWEGGVDVFEKVWGEVLGAREKVAAVGAKGKEKRGSKRKAGQAVEKGDAMAVEGVEETTLPFPFPRTPYSSKWIDEKLGKAVLLPIPGLATSFLTQTVECDVMRPHPHPDYFPVVLLAELLSRTEGPLYSAIRGPGYAYDATLHLSVWTGQLSFEVGDSSEPYKAYVAFQDILANLATEEGFAKVCGDFEIETARSGVAYRHACGRATGVGVVGTALRGVLRGYKSLEEEESHQSALYSVSRADLMRVYEKYFRRFCDGSGFVVITTPPGEAAKTICEEFGKGTGPSCVKFREVKVDDLFVEEEKEKEGAAKGKGKGQGGGAKGGRRR